MNSLNKDQNIEGIYDSLLNGKNSYLRLSRRGSSSFDPSWITVIEDCLYDLGEIINNPREVTKTDSNVTPIELAKKIDGESVQHLASHTQYIKEVDEHGNVVPSKILSHSNVDDIHTYENRFIATFIRQLMLFVEKRYEFITSNINLHRDDTLMVKNKTIIEGQEVEIETKITIRKEETDKSAVEAKDYIERILNMREYIQYYYNSPFMKAMKNERDVRRPILQTNIIRKNLKYRKCYETYLFIEKFDSLGVSYHVDENYQTFSEKERGEINYLMLSSYLSVQNDHEFESVKKTNKTYKPKILTSIDDEKFVYGDLLKGPIEFVRIDETYREYLRSKVKEDLPAHPNKYEREYYKEEYDYKKEQKMDEKQLDRLIARKQKEIAEFEKYIEKLIAQRDFEEAEQKRKELEALREYENKLLEIRRQRIIEAAEANKIPYDGKKPLKEEKKEETNNEAVLEEIALNESLKDVKPADSEPSPVEEPAIEEKEEEIPVVEEVPAEEPSIKEEQVGEPVEEEQTVEEEIAPETEEPEVYILVEEPLKEEQPVEEVQHEEQPEEQIEEPVIEVAPVEETPEEVAPEAPVYVEVPQEEPVPDAEPVIEPSIEEPVEESLIVEEPETEEVPEEEVAPEKGEVIYHVSGDSQVTYVNGHKEVVFMSQGASNGNEEVRYVEVPQEEYEEPVEQPIRRYIVKVDGKRYYVNDEKLTFFKHEATIFDDYQQAKDIKARFGGKVVKL